MHHLFALLGLFVLSLGSHYLAFLIPLPSPLIGLVLLLGILCILGRVPHSLAVVCQFLLKHMSLFFVPALVSVALYQSLLSEFGGLILLALCLSTVLSLWLTAWLVQKLPLSSEQTNNAQKG